jgi:hypothetical protein
MSKEEFEKFEETHFYLGANPPAFNKNREKEKNDSFNNENNNFDKGKKSDINYNVNNENFNDDFIDNSISKVPNFLIDNKNIQSENNFLGNFKENDKLSVISENEVNKFIYSDNEYIIRKHMWNIMFRDWLEEQREKEEKNKMQPFQNKKPRVKKIVNSNQNQSPYEAIKNSTKFGTKINYPYVQKIFQNK